MDIKNLIISARNGDLDSIQALKNHYIEKYSYLKDEIDFPNSEKLLISTINLIIDMYVQSNTVVSLCNYVRQKLKSVVRTNSWQIEGKEKFNYTINYIVNEARNGSDDARKQLIEYYMYIVDYFLSKYDLQIEYEDARQLGYLFLTKKINTYLSIDSKTDISCYLLRAFSNTFTTIIEKNNKKASEYTLIKNLNINCIQDSHENSTLKLEFGDFFDRQDISEESRYIFCEMCKGRSGQDIADDLDVSRSWIYQKNYITRQQLKSFFEI